VETGTPADLVLRRVRIEHTQAGERRATATLSELRYRRDTASAEGDTLVLDPVREKASQGSLRAARARFETRSGTLKLDGGVTFQSTAGDTLETPDTFAELARSTATGTSGITARGPGYTLTAPEFTADWEDEPRFRFSGRVRTTLHAAAATTEKRAKSSKKRPNPKPSRRTSAP